MLTADNELEGRVRAGLQSLDVDPARGVSAALTHFLLLLEKWNKAFNLTAVRDPQEMVARHLLDSLTARPFLHGATVLDVGTGAGLPGMPLAIIDADRQFFLLDSGGKKTRFVRHAVGELGLRNVEVVQARVEAYVPAEPFDTIICRAFASLREFVCRCGALAASDGRLVAMKGRAPDDELANLPGGWDVAELVPLTVPGLAGERHIVVLERKASATNDSDAAGQAR
jgi:16S rRNA (guanine527-N7)-methyltransferase